ncbi:MAG: hypothetical protein ACNA8W_04715, partial [Bradymonadaceae bacterium]
HRPHSECDVASGEEALALTMSLELTRYQGEDVRQSWIEERTYRRDENGHEDVSMSAVFDTEISLKGNRQGRWISTQEDFFIEEAPGQFSRRSSRGAGRTDLFAHGPGLLDLLLDAVDTGWELEEAGESGEKSWRGEGSSPLRCSTVRAVGAEPEGAEPAWKARLGARTDLLEARLRVANPDGEGMQRSLRIRWRLGTGEHLVLHYVDRILLEAVEEVESPEPSVVLGQDHDRSLAGVGRDLDVWMESGWIDRQPWLSTDGPPKEGEKE